MARRTQQTAQAELRDTPASTTELALLARYRHKGASPGNPKWYKSRAIAPFQFEAGLPAVTPAWTRSTRIAPQEIKIPTGCSSAEEYVREFDTCNALKPALIRWVTPTLGAFG